MSDGARGGELAEALCEGRRHRCPQMRAVQADWLYPVEGYCVLHRAPGWLMIPSVEEFQRYCTTLRFQQCPWFTGSSDDGAPEPPGVKANPPTDLWKPPGMPGT